MTAAVVAAHLEAEIHVLDCHRAVSEVDDIATAVARPLAIGTLRSCDGIGRCGTEDAQLAEDVSALLELDGIARQAEAHSTSER